MNDYDIIIAGAGLSGLSLACHLVRSPLAGRSILLVDRSFKERQDRTWAYWSNQPGLFDDAVCRTWNRLAFNGRDFQGHIETGDYRYQVIRGPDFFRRAKAELAPYPNVHFRRGRIERINDTPERAQVIVDGHTLTGRWVFDGRGQAAPGDSKNTAFRSLKMHFLGWQITTENPAFDPGLATFMDFRCPQEGSTRFFYLLPYSEREALVEFTVFSGAALPRPQYEEAIHHYLTKVVGIGSYQIGRRESGCLPLSDRPYPRKLGRRVMTIGLRGGRLKPSSGFAYTRIQRDSAAIVRSLQEKGHPFGIPADPRRYRASDSLLLEIIDRHGEQIETIFSALFKNNPSHRILRFLDQDAGPWEQLRIIPTLPPGLFIKTLIKRGYRHLVDRNWQRPTHPLMVKEY